MYRPSLLRYFSDKNFFRPAFNLNFDGSGKLLLYSTPSATTFLRIYAPINISFIAVHVHFSISEYLHPMVVGRSGYFWMTSGLAALGIVLAGTVEYFCRRFVKTMHLLEDGRHLLISFHTAYYVLSI